MSNKIILIACYELGHQPLSLAWPLAALKEAGFQADAFDLSIDAFPDNEIKEASFVGIAVPMHTALRIGVQSAKRAYDINPDAHICFFGLYAWLNTDHLLRTHADSIIAGEYERPLVELVQAIQAGKQINHIQGISTPGHINPPNIERWQFPVPDRTQLPLLSEYAHYTHLDQHNIAGYVEASRGCLHECNHCPIVPVYHGRFFVVPVEVVLTDIRQQVEAGARHITFGDPDFLNGPGHTVKITRALHAEFPDLTIDFTTKVEHILENKGLFPEFAELGCTFIISAFETTNDAILERLNKGHTVAQMGEALTILDVAGIAPQPTWMPFTPWMGLEDYIRFLGWIRDHSLIPYVPAVQLSIRMLVPPNSALLDHPDVDTWLGPLDQDNFTYLWVHPDPRMDQLQKETARLAEDHAEDDSFKTFGLIEDAAYRIAGLRRQQWTPPPVKSFTAPPRMTENWFC
jgi:radical SAM superfamily enzyme YgiQ (UPF0313 family)